MPAQLLASLLRHPRARALNTHGINTDGRCVVYWMQRAQRTHDNPALDAAIECANALGLPLAVFLAPRAGYPGANLRAYAFLADGFTDIAEGCKRRGAQFVFRPDNPSLVAFCAEARPALVVGDDNPLREPLRWREKAGAALSVALVCVDADAVVPIRLFAKREFAARTLRPKIHRVLGDFLVPSREPKVKTPWRGRSPSSQDVDPVAFLRGLAVDRSVGPVAARGGEQEGRRALQRFVKHGLATYHDERNKPDKHGTSQLSAFLHFGHLGPRAIALAVRDAEHAPAAARDAYLEELIVRRELAMNYVLHEPAYDRLDGSPAWARRELDGQREVPRPALYTARQLENAETADPLWNAGQKEMVLSGRMHGYVRMYWAKKVLEWSRSPEEAFDLCVRLNDRYELDGRDPNGYCGIAWAIGGLHDRPWAPRRPVFGTVRYMSLASTGRKFNLKAYVARVDALERGPAQRGLFAD